MKSRSATMLLCDAHSCIGFSRRLKHQQAARRTTLPPAQIDFPAWGAEGRWWNKQPLPLPQPRALSPKAPRSALFIATAPAAQTTAPKPPRHNPILPMLIIAALAVVWIGLHLLFTAPAPKPEIKRPLPTTTHIDQQ